MIKSYIATAESCINELPLLSLPPNYFHSPNLERTECFYRCIRALKTGVDNMLTCGPEETAFHPLWFHIHFVRFMHLLYRLSLMDDPAWDRMAVYNIVDILDSLERRSVQFESVPAAVGLETSGDNIFSVSAGVMRGARSAWRGPLEEAGAIPTLSATTSTSDTALTEPDAHGAPPLVGSDAMAPNGLLDLGSDMWFTEFSMFDGF